MPPPPGEVSWVHSSPQLARRPIFLRQVWAVWTAIALGSKTEGATALPPFTVVSKRARLLRIGLPTIFCSLDARREFPDVSPSFPFKLAVIVSPGG